MSFSKFKCMERKRFLSPFYLEYIGCIAPETGFEYSIVFRSVDDEYITVSRRNKSKYLDFYRSNVFDQTTIEDVNEINKYITSLREFICGGLDSIEFDILDSSGIRLLPLDWFIRRFLLSILNCLDISFSTNITDEVIKLWGKLKEVDLAILKLKQKDTDTKGTLYGKDYNRILTTFEGQGKFYSNELRNYFSREYVRTWEIAGFRDLNRYMGEVGEVEEESIGTILTSVEKLKEEVSEKLIKSLTYQPIMDSLTYISKYIKTITKGINRH